MRQISGFVLLMFLLMLISRVFSLVMLMLCLCPGENQPYVYACAYVAVVLSGA